MRDGVGGVVPRLVRKMGVGRDAVDLDAQLLERRIVVGEVAELGRADEGEVRGIEHHHGPLALEVLVRHRHELAVVVGGGLEGLDFGIDQRHGAFLVIESFRTGSHHASPAPISEID